MNIEELDGFFAALIAGPEIVTPSEYMPKVFGGETPETHPFESLEEAKEILGLMMRQWNDIAGTLSKEIAREKKTFPCGGTAGFQSPARLVADYSWPTQS